MCRYPVSPASTLRRSRARDIWKSAHKPATGLPLSFQAVRRSARILIPPAIPPHLLTDRARDARRPPLHWKQALRRHALRDLQHQFRADRLLELFALADRHDKSARAADHAILVIDIEVVDIHGESVRPL